MDIQFWASTDVGRVRDHNEDNFLVDKRLRLFVVCDGMGGHAAGEVASAMCVKLVREELSEKRDLIEFVHQNPTDMVARKQLMTVLDQALRNASNKVYEAALEDEAKRGMGTTCCMLLLTNHHGYIAHVGDSRIYLLREGDVHQMTEDHSLYNEMVRLGKIRPGEQVNLPNKNAVTRAVGVREHVDVDVIDFEIEAGDRFLICSDGLSGYFSSNEQIASMLSVPDVRTATEQCIDFAVEAGGKDNITAILVNIVYPGAARPQERPEGHGADVSVLDALKQSSVFDYLSQKELGHISKLIELRQFQAGDYIAEPGEELSDLSLILFGEVQITSPDGRELKLLEQGDHIGDLGFVDAMPSPIYLVARAPVRLVTMSRKQLLDLLRHEPDLSVKLLWNLLQIFAGQMRTLPLELMVGAPYDFLDRSPTSWEEDTKPPASKPAAPRQVTPRAVPAAAPPPRREGYGDQSSSPSYQSLSMAPATTPSEAEEMWGFEATRKGSLEEVTQNPGPLDLDPEEDLRSTTQFSREDIARYNPVTSSSVEIDHPFEAGGASSEQLEEEAEEDVTPPSTRLNASPSPLPKRQIDLSPPRAPRPVATSIKSGSSDSMQSPVASRPSRPAAREQANRRSSRPASATGIKGSSVSGTSSSAENPFAGARKSVPPGDRHATPEPVRPSSNPFDRNASKTPAPLPSVSVSPSLLEPEPQRAPLPRDPLAQTVQLDPDEFEKIKASHKTIISQHEKQEEH